MTQNIDENGSIINKWDLIYKIQVIGLEFAQITQITIHIYKLQCVKFHILVGFFVVDSILACF